MAARPRQRRPVVTFSLAFVATLLVAGGVTALALVVTGPSDGVDGRAASPSLRGPTTGTASARPDAETVPASPSAAAPSAAAPARPRRSRAAARATSTGALVVPSTPAPSAPTTSGSAGTSTRHVFPLSGCRASWSAAHHDYPATDVFAPEGCAFVAPVAGRVDEVGRTDTWTRAVNDGATRGGLFVSVVGDDGVRYYGSHLASVAADVVPGLHVEAGHLLGRVGDTGSAAGTGTHLHLGLSWPSAPGAWWIRRGEVSPSRYLDAWQRGQQLSPVDEVAAARREADDLTRCRAYC